MCPCYGPIYSMSMLIKSCSVSMCLLTVLEHYHGTTWYVDSILSNLIFWSICFSSLESFLDCHTVGTLELCSKRWGISMHMVRGMLCCGSVIILISATVRLQIYIAHSGLSLSWSVLVGPDQHSRKPTSSEEGKKRNPTSKKKKCFFSS